MVSFLETILYLMFLVRCLSFSILLVVKHSVTHCSTLKWTVDDCQAAFLSKHYMSLVIRPFLKASHLFLWHTSLPVRTSPPTSHPEKGAWADEAVVQGVFVSS